MPNKLTDSEIVKALECCCADDNNKNDLVECESCPYVKNKDCTNDLRKDSLDLINRLQAENNRKDKIYIDLLKTSSERADIISSLKAENERLKGKKQQRRTKEINFEDMKW